MRNLSLKRDTEELDQVMRDKKYYIISLLVFALMLFILRITYSLVIYCCKKQVPTLRDVALRHEKLMRLTIKMNKDNDSLEVPSDTIEKEDEGGEILSNTDENKDKHSEQFRKKHPKKRRKIARPKDIKEDKIEFGTEADAEELKSASQIKSESRVVSSHDVLSN